MHSSRKFALLLLVAGAIGTAFAAEEEAVGSQVFTVVPSATNGDADEPWLDRAQQGLHEVVWRSAMRIDRMFGAEQDESAYEVASGSLTPALLWNEFDGFEPRLRFRVNLPLPQLDERFGAFLGRVDREEYVTERAERSGAIRRQYGPAEDEQTLFGIYYRNPPREGWRFDAGAGVRVEFPLDPYVKAAWRYERGSLDRVLVGLRETIFWQNSEEFGLTSRLDVERMLDDVWLGRWTVSGTVSQRSQGLRGYSTLTFLRGFPGRRAIAMELFVTGEADADVPLHEYGGKIAWRQSLTRDWLILEAQASVTWPKDLPEQPREPSWGIGVGFEILFGDEEFWAQPVMF